MGIHGVVQRVMGGPTFHALRITTLDEQFHRRIYSSHIRVREEFHSTTSFANVDARLIDDTGDTAQRHAMQKVFCNNHPLMPHQLLALRSLAHLAAAMVLA